VSKVIRDGKVAVLYSPGYGAGWSTWNYEYPEMLFDPEIVEFLEQHENDDPRDTLLKREVTRKIEEIAEKKYPDGYFGGADDLTIVWLDEGTHFIVNEYDGSESINVRDDMYWIVA
jgi:hypothetical protein